MQPTESRQQKKLNPVLVLLSLSFVFFILFLLFSAFFFFGRSTQPFSAEQAGNIFESKKSVGVIELDGVIMESKPILEDLKSFEENDKIQALVVRLNSPGGSVAPSQEIYRAIQNFPKPVVASMGSVAASGAYYVSCGADHTFANPGTLTGSIGVLMEFRNLSELYDWAKIERYAITTGEYKDLGADYRDMRPDERKLIQRLLEEVLSQFKKAVSEGRDIQDKELERVADGRILSGSQAKEANLVDEMGSIKKAIKKAAKMGGIEGKDPNVVYPKKEPKRLLRELFNPERRGSFFSQLGRWILSFISGEKQVKPVSYGTKLHELKEPGIYWIWDGAY